VLSANVTNAFDCDIANSGVINLLVSGGTTPFTYSWSNGATTEDLNNVTAGNYLVTVTDARGCVKTAQYSINRPPPIVIGVTTKTDVNCDTKEVKQNFTAQVSGGLPPYQLSWSSGTVSGANNQIMSTSQNGTIILNVTDALGCKANYSFNVSIPSLGTPSFTTNSYGFTTYGFYSIEDPVQFTNTATDGFIAVSWDFGDGSLSDEINPVHIFKKEGSYIVTQRVTYPLGCAYNYTLKLEIKKGYNLMYPNAFTPNKDGFNDYFSPVFKGLTTIEFDVYDTWGGLIYSETGETIKGWDGMIKNQEAENGNYYFKVTAKTFYGAIIKDQGAFVLIK
jgi:gliding motility-associated-like protein